MNASSQSCFRKGAVLNPKHAAPGVAMVGKATRLFRLVTVRGSLGVGALAAQQSSPLFGFRLLGRNAAQPRLANLFSRFGRTNVVPMQIRMALAVMLLRGKAFKILNAVVSLVAVDVMNLLKGVKTYQPAGSHNSVHEPLATQHKIALVVDCRRVRLELSESFSATRNSVQVVKKSILDTVYLDADHVVPHGG
jgi:hypothetical protein